MTEEADGKTLHIGPTPLLAFFYSTRVTNIYFPYVALGAPLGIFGFTYAYSHAVSTGVLLAGIVGFHLVFLSAFLLYKWFFWSSVAITVVDGSYAVRERGSSKVTAVWRLGELTYKGVKSTGMDSGWAQIIFEDETGAESIGYLSFDDLDLIVAFIDSASALE